MMITKVAVVFFLFIGSFETISAAFSDSIEKRQAPQIDCSLVRCARPIECEEKDFFTPPGECCPRCSPDCSTVSCLKPVCEEGEVLETPPGECCPVCTKPNCAAVLCLAITDEDCAKGETVVVPPGECCAVCQKNCSAVSCLKPVCEEGQTLEVPNGECCPVCVTNLCSQIKGQVFNICGGCDSTCIDIINEERRFCPAVCRPGCSCPGDQVIDTITGSCVARKKCTNPCAAVSCAQGSRCKVNRTTNEAYCTEPSCDINNGGCAKDEICQLKTLQCLVPPCPKAVQCLGKEEVCILQPEVGPCDADISRYFFNSTSEKCERFSYGGCEGNANNFETLEECQGFCVPCPFEGQIFSLCSGCDSTCVDAINEEQRLCPAVCLPGCGCPGAQLIDTVTGSCVPREECTNPCAAVRCAQGSRCKVNRTTNEAYCTEPSCDINNGGCAKDEICQLQTLQCLVPPCPKAVQCLGKEEVCTLPAEVGPCRAAIPRYFHNSTSGQCELFTYGGCRGNANNFETLKECERFCGVRDPCATVRCRRGHRCEVFKPTGEPFCTPDCSLSNGGCARDEICTLQEVQCVRAPCPPVVKCCPPKCSKEFCAGNPRGVCSNPGPLDVPGCTGSCHLSFCKACIFSRDEVNDPDITDCPVCADINDYTRPSVCYWRWARCAGHRYWVANRPNRRRGEYENEHIICLEPPCPRRG